jgi:hypothetical protein
MYRDRAQSLDEHDRAVGAILIGEALVDHCDRAAARVTVTQTPATDRWRAVHEVHDTYPEIWRHLDRARGELARRGANTVAYDELRPHVKRAATDSEAARVDASAIDEAKRAVAELKLAVPGADWRGIAQRTAGLVRLPIGNPQRHHQLVIGAVIIALAMSLCAWFIETLPVAKPSSHDVMRRELHAVSSARKSRIAFLSGELGDRCLPFPARELVRLMVLDGRTVDARAFGAQYTARCGPDGVVDDWAHAPRPGH